MKSESRPIPFSISPDALEYLCQRLIVMPSEAQVTLILATGQTDDQKPPRWVYEGHSFIFGYFEEGEKPRAGSVEYEIAGRSVAIEPGALKELSGRRLALRRVGATRGVFNNYEYVLVADPDPGKPASSPVAGAFTGERKRKLSIAAFTILGGFTGMGVIWLFSALTCLLFKISLEKLFAVYVPIFAAGWIAGAIISFYFSRFVFKTSGRTLLSQDQIQRKYLGFGGLEGAVSWWVVMGVPMPPTLILTGVLWPHVRTPEGKAALAFCAIMLVFTPCLYLCDRLPRRWIISAGIVGWLLTLALGFWYFKTHGP